MANTINHADLLNYLANAARRVLPLTELDNYNVAVKELNALILDRQAQEKIAAAAKAPSDA